MNRASLKVVTPAELPDPPYPPDVRARGWMFTLDVERIHQSAAWVGCKPRELRNALLRLWMESWTQVPCGSLPADDDLIAQLIDVDEHAFRAHRDTLLHGWYRATDGRLYHRVITEFVETMRDSRRADRERKRKAAKAGAAPISGRNPPESAGVPRIPLLEQEQDQEQDQEQVFLSSVPNGTDSSAQPTRAARKSSAVPPCPHQRVLDLYNEVLGDEDCSKATLIDTRRSRRRPLLDAFWRWVLTSRKPDGTRRATNADEAMLWIRRYFERAQANDWLMRRVPHAPPHEHWRCSIDYLLSEAGMQKVIEQTR